MRMVAGGLGRGLVLLSAVLPPAPQLVWNESASAPQGLYDVTPGAWVEPGEMVIARVPHRYRQLADARRYLPMNVPMVQRVAAYAGDRVCASGLRSEEHTSERQSLVRISYAGFCLIKN